MRVASKVMYGVAGGIAFALVGFWVYLGAVAVHQWVRRYL